MDNKIAGFIGYYRFLSNFYSARVEVDGFVFLNNEAAFQSYKCKWSNAHNSSVV